MATIQIVMRDKLLATPALMLPEPAGLGFLGVFAKWLYEDGDGGEPDMFTTGGAIKPAIWIPTSGNENRHPSANVPGWRKWDAFPTVYLAHAKHEHGKDILDRAKLVVESVLTDPTWAPVITGGQLPTLQPDTETHIDDNEQFPKNYVTVLRFRVTGIRSLPVV